MDTWYGKSVVVTGGSGFLGRVVVRMLGEAGATVNAPARGQVNLLHSGSLLTYLNRCGYVDALIHIAGKVGGINAVSGSPYTFMQENLAMGLNAVDEAVLHGCKSIIYTNSVCAYPYDVPVPTQEDVYWEGYPERTNAPYGLAKKVIGELLLAARAQYGIRAANLVLANMYGPGDNFDPVSSHVIPSLIRRMVVARDLGAPEVIIWGSGNPTRDFLYVDDAARAILRCAHLDHPSHLNVSAGQETSIWQVAEMVAEATGYAGKIVADRSKPDGQPRRRFDSASFRSLTGWEDEVVLDEGIMRTVAWFEERAK